jgi:hypothetical protein
MGDLADLSARDKSQDQSRGVHLQGEYLFSTTRRGHCNPDECPFLPGITTIKLLDAHL